jgi:hypothetical protein
VFANELTILPLFIVMPLLFVALAIALRLRLVRRVTRQVVRGVGDEVEG